ncbi:hypothetical protein DMH04_46495 [Kibdelosporangium aridum]|uniref:AlgX/AlgJ SGNH hydrolase-like domain-containing protein n=1 Tax=Kibdelosporangium aridum TaxID=2030 RepID=A0A428YMJ5_KIBAR|nr:hypothetical protein [Kibdelosporangium aridum]RSM69055.1 hypothetical protein DMH04_46495 [Kibdelosporangium aridum]
MAQSTLPPVHEAWLPREHSLYRPRHGVRQLTAIICAVVFFALPLISLTVGMRPTELENHRLASFPNPGDGWSFFTNFNGWSNDHLPFRREAIDAVNGISRGLFGEPPNLGRSPQQSGPVAVVPGPQQGDKRQINPGVTIPLAIEGKNGWMYYGDDVVSRCNQARDLKSTMDQIRRLREGVEASGRKFVMVVAPDKTTIVPENLPNSYAGKDCMQKVNSELWPLLTAEKGVVDLRGELHARGQQLGKPVYPPLDGHWWDEGGLVLARRLAEAIHPTITRKWVTQPVQEYSIPADTPPLIGLSGTNKGFMYSLKPDGERDQTRNLSPDFNTPVQVGHATGQGTVTESVGMLSDSFTIRALRYLAASFGDLTVLHYGKTPDDNGRAAGEMLAQNEVVAVEVVERTIASGNNQLLQPAVVDGIVRVLQDNPIRK